MSNDMVKLGVLWKRMTREGNRPFLTGPVRDDGIDAAVALLRKGGRFLVVANKTKREGRNDPDCELFVVPDRNGGKEG
jgi:hypothetical protein